ncbi:MAG: hypothetical protein ACOC80_07130 [Petrotogales bacterium]
MISKKLLTILFSIVFISSFILVSNKPAKASDTDTFDIIVQGEYLFINVTNTSWNLGVIEMSSVHYTNETSNTWIADLDNTSVNSDLSLQITDDASDWSAATSGNGPGADTYRLNASTDTWATENQIVTASDTVISSNIPAGNNETFDTRFDAPTSTSTGAQQTITVTATLSKH